LAPLRNHGATHCPVSGFHRETMRVAPPQLQQAPQAPCWGNVSGLRHSSLKTSLLDFHVSTRIRCFLRSSRLRLAFFAVLPLPKCEFFVLYCCTVPQQFYMLYTSCLTHNHRRPSEWLLQPPLLFNSQCMHMKSPSCLTISANWHLPIRCKL
jgi:hypothetical protein